MLCVRVPLGSWKAKATRHERALTILLLQADEGARAPCQTLGRASGPVAGFMQGLSGGRGEHPYCCIALPSAHLSLACRYIPVLHNPQLQGHPGVGGFIPSRWVRQGRHHIDTYRFNTILLQNLSLAGSFMLYSLYCLLGFIVLL